MTETTRRPAPPRLCYRSVSFRATQEGDPGDGLTLEGYAAVFGQPTRVDSWEGTFDEEIARGAFRKTLRERKPVLQFDHGRDMRTGSVPIGAIGELREDAEGLYVRARLFDNPVVEPIQQAIAGEAIDGMSFRFRVVRDEWRDKNGKLVKPGELEELLWSPGERGPLKRTIREVELFELGPVVFPAYEGTSVGVRSLLDGMTPDDRQALVHDLADELRTLLADDPTADAARDEGTSDRSTDAAQDQGTSDPDPSTEADPPPVDTSLAARRQMARRIEAERLGVGKE